MVKGVFTTKESSAYNDRPWDYYHFPKDYLNRVEQLVGDLVVYYEPRRTSKDDSSRGGKQAYFAVCHVTKIEPDLKTPDHYYAYVDSYLRFEDPVPFREDGLFYESALKREDGATNKGAFRHSVRIVPDHEFDTILKRGFARNLEIAESAGSNAEPTDLIPTGLNDSQAPFDRSITRVVSTRSFRDRSFTLQVQSAYDNRCAITGLRLLNGGGRPEIEAAHIKSVADLGPDTIQNGIALSRTAHWMFDRGLISISDDFQILKSKSYPLGDAERLINDDMRVLLPDDTALRPHPAFLEHHRTSVFKE